MNKSLCLFALVLLAGCATTPPDRDQQARISYAEFARSLRADGFAKADKNNDGRVTWAEWQQFDGSPEARRHFDLLDTNGDGEVNPEEWRMGLEKTGVSISLFKQLDTDADGMLVPSELRRRPVSGLFQLQF